MLYDSNLLFRMKEIYSNNSLKECDMIGEDIGDSFRNSSLIQECKNLNMKLLRYEIYVTSDCFDFHFELG